MVLRVKFLHLVLAFCIFVGCSAVKLREFVGFPFTSANHETFPSNDDSSLKVAFTDTRPVIVNGNKYNDLHINNNGAMTFSKSSGTYRPHKFPFIGSEYLAVLWTDIDTRGCSESNATNTVYYKEITGKDLGSSCTFEEINTIVESSYEFHKSIAGCTRKTFQTRWAFVVTWHEVGFYGERCTTSSDFQVILATDGALTYAIYNYGKIQKHERDTAVGVNAGDGVHYQLHPNSHSHLIFDIEDHPGNTGALGQLVYRIDVISNETRSLCSGAARLAQSNTETKSIRLIPSTGTVFGGTAVRVIGPCAKDVEDILCTFGSQVVDGTFSPANGQILCVTPEFVLKIGQQLPFSVTFIKDGKNNTFKSNFYTSIVTNDVKIVGDKEPLEFGDRVNITWDPDFLAVPNSKTFTVDIAAFQLVGKNITSQLIGVVLSNIPNSGQATFTIPNIETTDVIAIVLYKVTLSEEHSIRKRQSRRPPTGGSSASRAVTISVHQSLFDCQAFLADNDDGAYLLDLVERCPVTVTIAREPISKFEEETDICFGNIITAATVANSPDAEVCFKQKKNRPGTTAGNNCCYGADGNLCTYVGCAGAIDKVLPRAGNIQSCRDHLVEDLQHHSCPGYYDKRPIYRAPSPPPAVCESPCENGGSCTSPSHCECTAGWSGDRCGTAVCESPCENGGSCTSPSHCECTAGWSGDRCETESGGVCPEDVFVAFSDKPAFLKTTMSVMVFNAYSDQEVVGIYSLTGGLVANMTLGLGQSATTQVSVGSYHIKSNSLDPKIPFTFVATSSSRGSFGLFKAFPAEGEYYSPLNQDHNQLYSYVVVSAKTDSSLEDRIKARVHIVSAGNSTLVSIIPVSDSEINGTVYLADSIVQLNMEESSMIDVTSSGDLTGTVINSTKPLVVVSEHECAQIPVSKSYCDQVVEQLPPVHTWGRSYLASGFKGRKSGALVKIVSAFPSTLVHIFCQSNIDSKVPLPVKNKTIELLFTASIHTFNLRNKDACSITATKVVQVAEFSLGGYGDRLSGDPSMVILASTNQYGSQSVVYLSEKPQTLRSTDPKQYVSIYTASPSASIHNIRIDGVPVAAFRHDTVSLRLGEASAESDVSLFATPFTTFRVKLEPGFHTIRTTEEDYVKFGVVAYGFGRSYGYAYTAHIAHPNCLR